MRKFVLGFVVIMGLWACSKEDWPDNSGETINFFAVSENATGEEAELRRNFFDETGVYLLFSDTLGYRIVSTLSGETIVDYHVIDFMWQLSVGSYYTDSLEFFPYLEIKKMKVAAKFIQEEILANLPELFYPYSVLLVERMILYKSYYGIYDDGTELGIYAGMQSTAIALDDIEIASVEEKEMLKNEVMKAIIINGISLIQEEDLAIFHSYSEDFYNVYTWNLPSPVQLAGFLPSKSISYSKSEDVLNFVEKIFDLSEVEFREIYAEYPLVIKKMEEMIKVLREYGVDVYS